jgi:16S rRNA (guanine527-N7)-methyltransferase
VTPAAQAEQEQRLQQGLQELGLVCPNEQVEALLSYIALLQKWNRKFNLFSESDSSELLTRHILDSLAIAKFVDASPVLDVGSGGGLPGIPLAIINPDKDFVLLDSNGKKTRFLFQVKVDLGLDNVSVENCRIEHYQSPRQLAIVMCRAFASLSDVVNKSQPLLGNSCKLLAMKGQYPGQEIEQLPPGFKVTRVEQLSVPGTLSQRHIVEIRRSENNERDGQLDDSPEPGDQPNTNPIKQ